MSAHAASAAGRRSNARIAKFRSPIDDARDRSMREGLCI
jgi:hypothetical protein